MCAKSLIFSTCYNIGHGVTCGLLWNYLQVCRVARLPGFKGASVHGCKCAGGQVCKAPRLQGCKCARLQVCRVASVQGSQASRVQVCTAASVQGCKCARLPGFKGANVHGCKVGAARGPCTPWKALNLCGLLLRNFFYT